jgi:hypothetical protein
MPKKAKPFVLDIDKVKSDFAKGKFPYKIPCSCCEKLCGNTSMEIFKTRIDSYGNIDKLYKNYVCTHCRKTKNVVPVKEAVNDDTVTNEAGEKICKEAYAYMPSGKLDYFWRHPLFNLPSDERRMIETGDGYATYIRTPVKSEA